MTTVAFIGLGIMGGPMAANLVKAGFDVIGYNRSPAKVDALVDAGGRGADSVAEAVRDADVIITMVPDSPDVEAVTGGDDGIFANAKPGALYIDMILDPPGRRRPGGGGGRKAGLRVLDAPVSGGEAGAIEASLSIMVGGERRRLRGRAARCSRPSGKTIVHVGPAGLGPDRQGREPADRRRQHRAARRGGRVPRGLRRGHEAALEVLGGGLAGSTVLDRKGANMLAREFTPGLPARPAPQGPGHRHRPPPARPGW